MMYGGGGGSDESTMIIIVLMICCCLVVGLSGLYTCTGGTFDFDQFNSAKCLTIPGEDEDDGGGGGGGGGGSHGSSTWESENPGDLNIADDYLTCVGTIFPDETRTCFNSGNEGAGVRWTWQETDEALECAQKVVKWRIDLTSGSENHGRVYSHTINQSTASSFAFINAPSGFVTNSFVRFRINALDFDGNLVLPSVNIELDASSSTASCGDVGISNAIEFSTLELEFASGGGSEEGSHLPPPPENPVNCTTGEWYAVGGCMVDGVEEDPDTCGPSCTQTYRRDILTPAAHGGTCITEESRQVQRQSCNPKVDDPAIDCVVGEWFDTTGCSTSCGTGTKTQNRPVLVDDENGGQSCPALVRQVACNTQECPVNCVGNWDRSACERVKSGSKGKTISYRGTKTYRVTQAPNSYGSACSYADGTTQDCGSGDFSCTGSGNSRTCTVKT